MMRLRILAALLVLATNAYAESPEKPLKDATEVDPHATVALTAMDGTPLVINPSGNGLMRGAGTPTTLGVVEGSRVPIPRNADGTCPDVEAILVQNIDAPMVIWNNGDPADGVVPHSFLAGEKRAELNHRIDNDACEVVITRARGYVAYKKKVIKNHMKGRDRRALEADGFFDEPIDPHAPMPTPEPGRAAAAPPPNVPTDQPAFRATPLGTIEPVTMGEAAPRIVLRPSEWNPCILYEFESWAAAKLYQWSSLNPTLQGPYVYSRARMRDLDYPWRAMLRMSDWGYIQRTYQNYYLSPQSYTQEWNKMRSYAPWLQVDNITLAVRQTPEGAGPGFSIDTHVWIGPWNNNEEWRGVGVVPKTPYPSSGGGHYSLYWQWNGYTNNTVYGAVNVCNIYGHVIY